MNSKENLEVYSFLSITPQEARKEIKAGRLNGMTDINPMWRIKMLTEAFGVCGFGWKYSIISKRLEMGCKNQISAFVDIELFIKMNGEWSEPIPGTGGSSFVADESKGLYQSDECFKMALTDAISVSCKALGMSADIYFSKDRTKYNSIEPQSEKKLITQTQKTNLIDLLNNKWVSEEVKSKTLAWINDSLDYQIVEHQINKLSQMIENKGKDEEKRLLDFINNCNDSDKLEEEFYGQNISEKVKESYNLKLEKLKK